MGRYQVNAVSVADLGYLLGSPARSHAAGAMTWAMRGRRDGRAGVKACVSTICDTYLRLTYPLQRPWMVCLAYIGNDVPLRRVCVNGHQRKVPGPCHMHDYVPMTGEETAQAVTTFSTCPPHTRAQDVPYKDMFTAFATLCGVDLTGLQWTDPPELTGGDQMNTQTLRDSYLDAVASHIDVTETPNGLVVWTPLFYSDGDGVVLSVYRNGQGWLVTDEGSTLSHLADCGVNIESPAFTQAWNDLAYPTGFSPGGTEGTIEAWCDEASLGDVIHNVATASVRAEGLAFMRDARGGRRPFSATVRERTRYLLAGIAFTSRGLARGNGMIPLGSGRSKKVTETITRSGRLVAALQALGGQTKETREQAHEHCYTIYSQSTLPQEHRLAIVGNPDVWDKGILREAQSIANVVRYRNPRDLDTALGDLIEAYPPMNEELALTVC